MKSLAQLIFQGCVTLVSGAGYFTKQQVGHLPELVGRIAPQRSPFLMGMELSLCLDSREQFSLPFATELARCVKGLSSLTEHKQHTNKKKHSPCPSAEAFLDSGSTPWMPGVGFTVVFVPMLLSLFSTCYTDKVVLAQGAGISMGRMCNLENQTLLCTSLVTLLLVSHAEL